MTTVCADKIVGSQWLHIKSQKRYMIVGTCRLESTNSPAYLYLDDAGIVWARDKDEFLDGRFQRFEPMEEHDEGCPQHGKDHVCNNVLYLEKKQ